MKSVYKIFAVILAAGLAAMSCDKKPINEDIPVVNPEGGDETDPEDGPRVITVSFNTKATRTDLDEDTWIPSFARDDIIVVTDGNVEERCPVYFDGEYARINITEDALQDKDVTAVYPESAYIGTSPYFKVPSVQDGTFANANICKTTIEANKTSAVFKNQTAVFRIELLDSEEIFDEIMKLTVSSLGKIENGHRGDTKSIIANNPEDSYTIELPLVDYDEDGPYNNPLYVSVLCDGEDPVLLSDLNFDIQYYHNFYVGEELSWTTVTSMGGFSPKFLGYMSDRTVSPNDIYTGVEDHLHEYVLTPRDATKPGSTDMKWAIEDLSNGEYFMWGELSGHAWNDSWTGFTNDYGFSSSNYTNPKYTTITANGVLRLEDDAAYYNWGGAWRMPTSGEWDRISGSGGSSTLIPHLSKSDYASGNSTPSSSYYYYWSSTLNSPKGGFNPTPIQVNSATRV